MELNVNHTTTFHYAGPVQDSVNEVRLCPRSDAQQVCLDFRLTTDPPAEVRQHADYFGNTVHTFDVSALHTALTITARSRVITQSTGRPVDLATLVEPYRPLPLEDAGELIDFLQATLRVDFHPDVRAFAEAIRDQHADRGLGPLLWTLSHALHERFEYVPGATDIGTIAGDAFAARRGVCQDYTHVFLAALRMLGVPARYTSGYFYPRGEGEVGSQASHAWAEAWFPTCGWVGIDPTNDCLVNEHYIRVAYGRDYADITPVKGSYRGAETSSLAIAVSFATPGQEQQQQQQ